MARNKAAQQPKPWNRFNDSVTMSSSSWQKRPSRHWDSLSQCGIQSLWMQCWEVTNCYFRNGCKTSINDSLDIISWVYKGLLPLQHISQVLWPQVSGGKRRLPPLWLAVIILVIKRISIDQRFCQEYQWVWGIINHNFSLSVTHIKFSKVFTSKLPALLVPC